MADANNKKPDIQMIPTDKIVPNPWNPNQMSDGAFEEYVAEVERLHGLPKSVIVRPLGDKYQVVDGEHAWRAAKELGFGEVPCEVLDIDNFEAMRQTYRRNRGGEDNPLKLGLMFDRMKSERSLSNRKLAVEMDLSEGSVRTHLDFVLAFKTRSRYAPETAEEEISRLSHPQARCYLELPEQIANKWLDAGADKDDLDRICNGRHYELGDAIIDAGLADLLEPTPSGFCRSLEYAVALCQWRKQYQGIEGINKYIRPLAELHLPVWLLDELPCAAADKGARVCTTPKEWATILKSAASHAENGADLQASVQSGVRLALGRKKIDIAEVLGPQVAEQLQLLQSAPKFILEAYHMSLEEQCELAAVADDGLPEGVILRAKEMVCDQLRRQRSGGKANSNGKTRRRAAAADESVVAVFRECLQRVRQEEALAEEENLFADQDRLAEVIRDKLSEAAALDGVTVDDRPAAEMLAERLDALDWPEYFVLATAVLHTDALDIAASRWLDAVGGQVGSDAEDDEQEEVEEDEHVEEEDEEYHEDGEEEDESEEYDEEDDEQDGYEEEDDDEGNEEDGDEEQDDLEEEQQDE